MPTNLNLMPTKPTKEQRAASLMPNGEPRYVRCYDNGGVEKGGTIDRYTVCFTGRASCNRGEYVYLAMSAYPFHPQGFGQHGSTKGRPCDLNKWGFAPAMGKKIGIGTRIPFSDLTPDCKKLVVNEYKDIWGIE